MERLLKDKEVAKMLGVSLGTLRNWRKNGMKLGFVQMGRTIRYRMSEIERFLNEHTRHAIA